MTKCVNGKAVEPGATKQEDGARKKGRPRRSRPFLEILAQPEGPGKKSLT